MLCCISPTVPVSRAAGISCRRHTGTLPWLVLSLSWVAAICCCPDKSPLPLAPVAGMVFAANTRRCHRSPLSIYHGLPEELCFSQPPLFTAAHSVAAHLYQKGWLLTSCTMPDEYFNEYVIKPNKKEEMMMTYLAGPSISLLVPPVWWSLWMIIYKEQIISECEICRKEWKRYLPCGSCPCSIFDHRRCFRSGSN